MFLTLIIMAVMLFLLPVSVEAKASTKVIQYNLTANRSMTVYNSPNSGKKVTTLVKGQRVTIDKLYINSKCTVIYLHVKLQNGKTGWVKGVKDTSPENKMFQEVEYAG